MMTKVQQRNAFFGSLAALCFWFAQLANVDAQCLQIYDNTVTDEDIRTILDGHNHLRDQIARGDFEGLPKGKNFKQMKYDERLAQAAQKIADSCVFKHQEVFDDRWPVGQNLATTSSTANIKGAADWDFVLRYWSDESKVYKYGVPHTEANRHFTQMIWADTEFVGCGYTHYRSNDPEFTYVKLYVCHYGPQGNTKDTSPYQRA